VYETGPRHPQTANSAIRFGDKLNVDGQFPFMNQLAPQPFVEHMLDGLAFASIFDAQFDRMTFAQKPFESFAILQLGIPFTCACRYSYERNR